MKRISIILSCLLFSLILGSCKKYLDLKPDQSLYIPSTLTDCQALLDDYSRMNASSPGEGEVASDHYYLTDASWKALLNAEDRDNYIWAGQGHHLISTWTEPYNAIFNSNLVLQVLDKISPNHGSNYNEIKGAALFFRGFVLYNIASLYCDPYKISSSNQALGVPVRLSPDIDKVYGRGTVEQTYGQIIKDLKDASQLLPASTIIPSRPNKAAAFACLARVYLSMQDYVNAGIYADSCLKRYNTLMNYYLLPSSSTSLFKRFNEEVIFSATSRRPAPLVQTTAKIVKSLYDSYNSDDLRKVLFFRANTGTNSGTWAFKGHYDGAAIPFIGLVTDEMYLIRSECYARAGKTTEALKDLNDLLKTRWQVVKDINGNIIKDINGNPISKYIPFTPNTSEEALEIILKEREKELVFRGTRWTDLRRLNMESKFRITLNRTINGAAYSLPPNDLRYTMLIPQDVINNTGVQQNPR